jgi:plastocyanin
MIDFFINLRVSGDSLMTNSYVRRTVQMSVLSTLFALVAFFSLTIGGVSAHTISQAGNSTNIASTRTNTVHIRPDSNGSFAFSTTAITVKVGTSVTFVNNTKARQILFSNNPIVFLVLAPGQAQTITPQLGLEQIELYDTASNLNITTVE